MAGHYKSQRSSSRRSAGEAVDLGRAIRNLSSEVLEKRTDDQGSGARTPHEQSAPERKYFVVHCTAFGASDEAMRRWVENRKKEGARYKSHGVILPSGEYLPIWPFDEAKVWATKTETCRETQSKALGAAVNIEVHYFCAYNRPDSPTEAQYLTLSKIYKDLIGRLGPLAIVSHREVDRGLKDGHDDPDGFSFAHFYSTMRSNGVDVDKSAKISDRRHYLRTDPDISHHWPPQMSGPLILEKDRPDDCKRDHRAIN